MAELSRPVQTAARVATAIPGVLPGSIGGIGRLLGALNIWFWAIVGVPTLFAGVYYFGIASDLYVSKAEFVVRVPHQAASFGQEAAEVKDYILSRDAARDLELHDNLRAVLSRPEGDLLSRHPGVQFWRHDFEALFESYQRFVTVDIDEASGIATLSVKAYRPEDAQRITAALVKSSEELVNRLNERARDDSLSTFRTAVQVAQQQIAKVQEQLTAYRIKEKMLDPGSASHGPLELVTAMEKELAGARGQLADMLRNAPRNPTIPMIRTRIETLESLISGERSRMTGDTNSVATTASEFERLDIQKKLDEGALASAYASLEAARLQVRQQQLYLEEIAQPNLPDYPLYPKRLMSFSLVAASCFLAYGIAWLLAAGVREHAV